MAEPLVDRFAVGPDSRIATTNIPFLLTSPRCSSHFAQLPLVGLLLPNYQFYGLKSVQPHAVLTVAAALGQGLRVVDESVVGEATLVQAEPLAV